MCGLSSIIKIDDVTVALTWHHWGLPALMILAQNMTPPPPYWRRSLVGTWGPSTHQ